MASKQPVDAAHALAIQNITQSTAAQKQKAAALESQMNSLYELEYRDEVIQYMYDMEGQTMASVELIDMQPELAWYMRPYLVDFLIEIHQQYRLRPETLYLALNIVDRYVSKRIVYKKHYQLVGCAALWIASKFEDAKDRVPTVEDLHAVCCSAYDQSAFIQMEGHVLSTIGWGLGHPTAEAWLRIACASGPTFPMEDARTQHVARFLMEITLFHRAFVSIKPSDIALACLALARYQCASTEELCKKADRRADIVEIAHMLDAHLAEHLDQVSATVVKKYAPVFYSRASVHVREWYLSGRRLRTSSAYESPSHPSSEAPEIVMTHSSPSSCRSSRHGGDSDYDDDELSYSSTPITPTTSVSSCSSSSDPIDRVKMQDYPYMPQQQQQSFRHSTSYFAANPRRQSSLPVPSREAAAAAKDVPMTQEAAYPAHVDAQHYHHAPASTVQAQPTGMQWQMHVVPPPQN